MLQLCNTDFFSFDCNCWQSRSEIRKEERAILKLTLNFIISFSPFGMVVTGVWRGAAVLCGVRDEKKERRSVSLDCLRRRIKWSLTSRLMKELNK